MGIVWAKPVTEEQVREQLQSQQNEAKLEAIRESVREEKSARITADNDLRDELREYVDSETAARKTSEADILKQLDSETALRITADSQLSDKITDEKNERTAEILRIDDALETERVERAKSESSLKTTIMKAMDDLKGENTSADSAIKDAINAEARTRTAEDAAINNAIEAERTERAGAISSLRDELQTAINANSSTHDSAEAELKDAIADEERTRANADTQLQGAITKEGTERQNAINKLQDDFKTAIDSEKTAREQAIANLNLSWASAGGAFAPLESPSFTGVPKVPSLTNDSDPLQIAPKNYVDNKLTAISENLSVFTSPTSSKPGKQGQVPAPGKGSAVEILTNFGWRKPNDATVTFNTIPAQSGSLTYNGNVQEPSWVNFDETKLSISGRTSASAAGTYTAIFTPIDLYMWSDSLDQNPREVTWEIGKLRLTKPTASNTAFTYDQAAHAPTVSNYSSNYMSQTGTASATNKGNYTLSYTLKDTANTCWNDGTADKVTLKWTIAVNKLTKPSVSKTEYDYTGSTITLSVSGFSDKYMSQSGTASATAVGNYTLKIALKDKTNTTWADGSTGDVPFNWKIAKKPLSAEMSTGFAQTGALTFNNNSQNVTISNYNANYHTLGGTTSASNAGTYEATVSPAASYTWSDGTSTAIKVKWTIAPKKIARPTASTTSFDYDGNVKTLSVTGYDSNTMSQTGTTSASAADSYSVSYTLKNTTNYNWTDGKTDAVKIDWKIVMRTLSAALSTGFAQEGTLTYTGANQTVTIKNYSSEYHVLSGVTSAKKVGTYVATIAPIDTYKWADGSTAAKEITWKISAKKLAQPSTMVTALNYDGTPKTLEVVGYDSTTMLQSGTISASAVGSYSVSYKLLDTDNYAWNDGSTGEVKITWTIAKQTLTLKQSTGFAQEGTLTFNNAEQSVTITNYSSTYHVLSGDLKSTDAGTFTAKISPAITHTWSDGSTAAKEITWTINPKSVTKPTASTRSFSYTGDSKNLQVSNYDSAYMERSGTVSESAVGEYSAVFALRNKTNYIWADGTTTDVEITWRITRAALSGAQSTFSVEGTYTFNGANQTVSIAGYDSKYHTLSGETSASESGSHAVTIEPKPSYTWNDGSTTPKEITWNIGQRIFTAPFAATTQFAYDKDEHELSITGYEPTYMTRSGTYKATATGSYTVTFTLKDTDNTRWNTTTEASSSIEWSIGMTSVPIPEIQTSTFTYDNNSKSPSFTVLNAAAVVAGGTTSATNAGSYVYTYDLADSETTVWSDGTTSTKSFNWKINRQRLSAAQSSFAQNGSLAYNGSSQSIIGYINGYDSLYHSISGQLVMTNAGSFVAYVAPLANYAWNDGTFDAKPLVWKIDPIKLAPPTAAETSFYADGTVKTLSVDNYNENYMERSGSVSAKDAGNYSVTYKLKNRNNAQWADGTVLDIKIDWQIAKRQLAKPTIPSPFEIEYTGEYINASDYIPGFDPNTMFTTSGNTGKDVGEYSSSYYIPNPSLYEWDDGDTHGTIDFTWRIVPAKIPAEYDSLYFEDATYTGKVLGYNDYLKYKDGDNAVTPPTDYVAPYNYSGTQIIISGTCYPTNAGTYTLILTPRAGYTWANGTTVSRELKWTVKPILIDASYSNPHLDENRTDVLYTGNSQSPTIVGYNSSYVKLGGDTSASDTGEYTITFTPRENYAWSDGTTAAKSFSWRIYKKVYVKPNASAVYAYKAAGNTLKVNNFDEGAMSQTGVATATDVGVYNAVYELVNTVSSCWADGSTDPVTVQWKIERVLLPFYKVTDREALVYSGEELRIDSVSGGKYQNIYGDTDAIIDTECIELSGDLAGTNADRYVANATPRAGYAWADGFTDTRAFGWDIMRKPIATSISKIPQVDTTTTLVYNGEYQQPNILNFDSDTMEINGGSSYHADWAGEYSVFITPKDNYTWGLSSSIMGQYGVFKGTQYGNYPGVKTLILTWRIEKKPMTERQEYVSENKTLIRYYTGSEQENNLSRYYYPNLENNTNTKRLGTTTSSNYTWEEGGELKATEIGEHTITMTIKSGYARNFCWSDGSTGVKEVKWYIAKERIRKPSITGETSYDYDGKEHGYNLSVQASMEESGALKITYSDGVTRDGTKFKATEVGDYYCTVEIVKQDRYAWWDTVTDAEPLGNSDPITFHWSIGTGGKTIITKPNILDGTKTELTYNGMLQALTVNGYDSTTMTQSGTISATRCGTYTVTYALKDKTNCVWEGGGTANIRFEWKIVEKPLSEAKSTFTARELTFNGSSQKLYIENYGAVNATGTTSDGELVWSGTISNTNAGTYTANVAPAANYCWADGSIASKNISWTIKPLLLEKPTASATSLKYSGATQNLNVSNYNSTYESQTGVVSGTAVDSYRVTYALRSTTNTKWADGTTANVIIDWEIVANKYTKPTFSGESTFTYDGSQKKVTDTGYNSAVMTRTGALSGTNAQSYSVTYSLKDKSSSRWADDSTDDVVLTWVINPKPLTHEQSTLSNGGNPRYNGEERSPTIKNFDAGVHDISGTTSAVNAGSYTITISPKANYCWENGTNTPKNIKWTISKSLIIAPYIQTGKSFVYSGETCTPRILPNRDNSTLVSVSGTTSAKDVGEYTVTYTLKDPDNYHWWGDKCILTETSVSVTWEITPKYLDKPTASSTKFTFNGADRTLSLNNFDSDTMSVSGNTASDAGTYTATVALKDKTNYRWTSETENDVADIPFSWTIDKKSVSTTMYTINRYSYVYNGREWGVTIRPGDDASAPLIIRYTELITGGVVNANWAKFLTVSEDSVLKATNAGTYEYKLTPTANCYWAREHGDAATAERTYTWTIEKAQATINVSSNTVNLSETTSSTGATLSPATVTFTTTSTAAVTVTSANTDVATVSKSAGKITISGLQNGTTTITIKQSENSNYYAPPDKILTVNVSRTLSSMTWKDISAAAKNGTLLKYGDIGDVVKFAINGTFNSLKIQDSKCGAVFLAYDHNPEYEGTGRATFAVMRREGIDGNIAFTDSYYGTQVASGTAFKHADDHSADFDYALSQMRAICTAFYNALPSNTKSYIVESKKVTADTGFLNDKVFPISSKEISGGFFGVGAAKVSDKQYEYFANGNDATFYDWKTGKPVTIWTRSASIVGEGTGWKSFGYDILTQEGWTSADANYSYGFVPCFTIG